MSRKAGACALIGLLAVLGTGWSQDQIEKAPIYRDTYPIVSETDFLCSFFVLEGGDPALIEAADSSDGMLLISEGQLVWAKAAAGEDIRPGQVFAVIERSEPAAGAKPGRSPVAFRRGKLRVVRLEGERFLGRIEKACGTIRAGCLLLPFEEKAPVLGKDLGYDVPFKGGDAVTGRLTFFRDGLAQIGPGDSALIDIGGSQGLRVGQQLTAFKKPEQGRPPRAVANVVVIDAGLDTATVKVLSGLDVLRLGDLVQVK